MKLNYLQNETLVSESDTKEITLTTHRIRQFISHAGKTSYVSIMLQDVVSVQMTHKKNYWFILLGACSLIAGFIALGASETEAVTICFIAAIVLIVLFFITMRGLVSINSAKGAIEFNMKGMNHEKIINFLELLEKTKRDRIESLKM